MNSYRKLILGVIISLLAPTRGILAQNKADIKPIERNLQRIAADLSTLSTQVEAKLKNIDTRALVSDVKAITLAYKERAIQVTEQWKDRDILGADGSFQSDVESGSFLNDQSKTIQKVYIISKNTPLAINNRYGKVDVKTWTKNEIKVDITIRAVDADGTKARDIINSVSIDEDKSANGITLTTQISKEKSSWWSNLMSGNSRGVQVNYGVYLPASNQLSVENAYGDVILPDLTGKVSLNISYGNITAGNLNGNQTAIKAGYLQAKINSVKNGIFHFEYGKLELGKADNLDLAIAYCGNSRIGTITNSGKIRMEYSGGFKVGLGKNIHNFALNTDYSNSDIRIDPSAHFTYHVAVSYSDFHPGKSTVTKEDPDPASRGPRLNKSYTGYYGNRESANQVTIDSDYGSIRFE